MKTIKTISFTLNGKELSANQGETILETALRHGIYIPNLCHHADLKPVGACRLCMVEVAGRGLVTACNTPVTEGMAVITDTPEIETQRRSNVELLFVNHTGSCIDCSSSTKCELQKIAKYIGINQERLNNYIKPQTKFPIDDSNPFFTLDPNKCVLCGICVRTCQELQNIGAIDFTGRGYSTVVAPFGGLPIKDSRCESCGECVTRCPTGALDYKKATQPMSEIKTVCSYCGCGCSLFLGVRGNQVVQVRGDRAGQSNRGSLCVKGRFGFSFINSPKRLTKPLIRKSGELKEVSWDEALDWVAAKLEKNRSKKFAFLASARCTNEDNYVMQKFTRAVMQTNNIDHCARLCHAPTVSGLAQTLGSGAMTNTIADIGDAKTIFAIGSNTTEAHPIIALQVKKAAAHHGSHLIVANPREIDLCRNAEIFLQHKPGSDVALLMGMARVIVDENLYDAEFIKQRCENFDEFRTALKEFPLEVVEKLTGVPRELITKAARLYATAKPASILYAMGITQHTHGTDNVIGVSNLALLTGNIGKYAAGVNPLRGQNNVQGSCDMGALPNVFPGYQKVDDEAAHEKFEQTWGTKLSATPGLTTMEIVNAIDAGQIRALYIAGENPVLSEADSHHTIKALNKLDFLVVQDIFLTETAQLADVVLPACSFAEKDGTFTNTERRVQRVRKAIANIGESRDDWWIICQLAKRLGHEKGFAYKNAEEIMEEIAMLTPSYHGINYARLENESPQWPCPDTEHSGTPILHTERFATLNGKAKFLPLQYRESAELPDSEYPLLLTTDRSLFHYHTATMTRQVEGLNILRPHEWLEMNPEDATKLGLQQGDKVKVVSRRGEVMTQVKVTAKSPAGVVSMTFHFAESPTNVLTNAAIDPVAKIPETKVCAVKIEKVSKQQYPHPT